MRSLLTGHSLFHRIAGIVFILGLAISLPANLYAQDDQTKTVSDYQKQAIAAYQAKDFATSLENFKKAAALVPNYPRFILNIAVLQTALGNYAEAFKALQQLADLGLFFAVDQSEEFASIRNRDEFKALLKKFAANKTPIGKSQIAFTLDAKALLTESVAYDSVTQTFFVSSVHQRKIVSLDKHGATKTFADERAGLWSVLGMKVDAKRRHLWATSSALPQMQNRKKEEEGLSGVFKFDLQTGRLIKKYLLPNTSAHHALGDLTLNARGEVFATDSLTPAVYRIQPQSEALELFLENPMFASPQGLCFAADDKHVLMADYARGLFAIDVNSKRVVYLQPPATATLHGIDGLYFYRGDLIATQNGVNPNRLVRLSLSSDFKQVKAVAVLEANNPLFDEPTLGVIIKDDFYFIANSQWRKVDDNGTAAPAEKWQNPLILRVKL
ncbi:MAG: hypothetical protein HY231_08605 [Acidobacteria bacterium]|nr:hypothetical protein [Acidobacteriota bacterium]